MPYQGGGGYGGGGYGGGGGGYGGGGFGGGGGGFGGRGGGRGGGGRGGGGGGRRNYDDPQDPNSEQFRKLFVGGLSYDSNEDSLRGHFDQWGEIADVVVMRDPTTKRSRGFGFITYKEVSQLDEAQKNRPHTIDGREVETKRAMPRDESNNAATHQSVTKMFVGGVKEGISEEDLRNVFGEFGDMKSCDIVMDKATGKSKGFCFIEFEDYDSVDRAVLKKRFDVNGKRVEVKKAVPKEQMNGGGSDRGGRGGGRGGGAGRGGGGYSNGGGFGGGYGSSGGGGYGGDSYGGGYNNQGWAGNGGGYGDYNNSWGGGGGAFGSNYDSGYGGGAMKTGGGYGGARGAGPYGGGYGGGGGGSAGGYGGRGGGGFRR